MRPRCSGGIPMPVSCASVRATSTVTARVAVLKSRRSVPAPPGTVSSRASKRPKPTPTALKLEPFECGATPVDRLNVKAIPIKYYAVAIMFILFDLETVFLFIWALGAQPITGFMLLLFAFFVFLLVLILLYVYKARLLEAVTE